MEVTLIGYARCFISWHNFFKNSLEQFGKIVFQFPSPFSQEIFEDWFILNLLTYLCVWG